MTHPDTHAAAARPSVTLAVLALASSAYLFQAVLVIPAFGDIARELDVGTTTVAWLLTAPLIVGAISPPILGRLGDMFGKAKMLVVALGFFLVGCAVSGLGAVADSTAILIAGRAIVGGGAAAFPLCFGIVRDAFPSERVAPALGMLSATFGIGAGLGLVLAGPILDGLSWDWLFWIGGLVVLVALVGAVLFVPESPVRTRARIDWTGAALLSAALVALLLGISQGETWGWDSARVIGLETLAIVLLAVWVRYEMRIADPLVDMRILRERGALATNLEAFLIGVAQFGCMAILPLLVQTPERLGFGFGASVTASGLFMLPATVAMLIFAPLGGVLGGKRGSRLSLALGAALIAAAMAWLAAAHDTRWEIYLSNALFGAGLGMAMAAIAHLVVESVHPTQTGVAAGMNAIARTVGGALGTQIAATIVAAETIDDSGLPAESGYTITFIVCACAVALAVVTAVAIPRRRAGDHTAAAGTADGLSPPEPAQAPRA